MPALVHPITEKLVGFRCQKHRDTPQLNLAVKFNDGHAAECGICCIDQGVDGVLAAIGEVVDRAAQRLDFFEDGLGAQLRQDVAKILSEAADTTPQTDEAKEPQ